MVGSAYKFDRWEGVVSFRVVRSAGARVEDGAHATNPEELLGAAEAACFTMSLANLLGEAGHPARDLRTTARVTLASAGVGFDITRIELKTVGDVPGIDDAFFADLAQRAKDCTVSRALAGTEITLDAGLAGG